MGQFIRLIYSAGMALCSYKSESSTDCYSFPSVFSTDTNTFEPPFYKVKVALAVFSSSICFYTASFEFSNSFAASSYAAIRRYSSSSLFFSSSYTFLTMFCTSAMTARKSFLFL